MCILRLEVKTFWSQDICKHNKFGGLITTKLIIKNYDSLVQQILDLTSDESYILNMWHAIQKVTCGKVWKVVKSSLVKLN